MRRAGRPFGHLGAAEPERLLIERRGLLRSLTTRAMCRVRAARRCVVVAPSAVGGRDTSALAERSGVQPTPCAPCRRGLSARRPKLRRPARERPAPRRVATRRSGVSMTGPRISACARPACMHHRNGRRRQRADAPSPCAMMPTADDSCILRLNAGSEHQAVVRAGLLGQIGATLRCRATSPTNGYGEARARSSSSRKMSPTEESRLHRRSRLRADASGCDGGIRFRDQL